MTDIVFSFDTEDFTSKRAADGILAEANMLKEEGVCGCFCLVGLLAKQLVKWGRTDVLEALSHHEIESHTYGHTLHPMINEYTDIEDFYEAQKEVIRQESLAIEYIKEATGVDKVYAACPPGNQKSYAAMYAYSKMGIPIYCDTFCDTEDGTGAYYCNIFHMNYTFPIEWFLMENGEEEIKKMLDVLAKRKRAIIYTHPNMLIKEEFWDELNYHKENLVPFGEWIEAKDRPAEVTERILNNMRLLVRLVKADKRFNITTYSKIAAELKSEPERIIKKSDIPSIYSQLKSNFFPVQAPCSLSLSDMMLACKDFLLGKETHTCADVYGFLEKPEGVSEKVTISANDIRESANQIRDGEFLPSKIKVGNKFIGPHDWLLASMEVILGGECVDILPKAQLPCLDVMPEVRDCSFKGTWQHSDSFEDKYLSDRLRYQSWTMRFLNSK